MRLEFLGKPVRVTDVSPGAVETEFSIVRFAGDAQAAKKVFPLSFSLYFAILIIDRVRFTRGSRPFPRMMSQKSLRLQLRVRST
jgi:hypothetical protein